jgi:hypothetical protein
MTRIVPLAAAALAALVLAAPASAQAPNPPLNGTYVGAYPGTTTLVAMSIRNNVIGPTSMFTMDFNQPILNGAPMSFFPGTSSIGFQNPGGIRINAQTGGWGIPGTGGEFGFFSPPLCGQSRTSYLVAGFQCNATGTGLATGAQPLFSLRQATPATLIPPSGTQFSGSVSATPRDPPMASNPATPWTGPEGTLSLTVNGAGSGATISGTASLTPVNPDNGIPTGAPPIDVTYGPSPLSATPAGNGLSTATGFFTLPSSPPGYTACGSVLPSGVAFGTISCSAGPSSIAYVPATFFLSAVSTG